MEQKEKKEKKDLLLMLDLETLGTKPGCVILSVAYKSFALDSKEEPAIDVMYANNINIMSSLLAGLTIDQKTVEWWQGQNADVRREIYLGSENASHIEEVMQHVYNDLLHLSEEFNLYICGRGVSTFDMPILDEAMRRVIGDAYKTPWKYWSATDVRGIHRFAKWCGMEVPAITTQHDAMADVEKQITEMQQAYNYINS